MSFTLASVFCLITTSAEYLLAEGAMLSLAVLLLHVRRVLFVGFLQFPPTVQKPH